MREVMKSLLSFSWATSLFGVTQLANLAAPQKAAAAFDDMTQKTTANLSDTLKGSYQAGDQLQREMIDLLFNVFNPSALMQAADAMPLWGQSASGPPITHDDASVQEPETIICRTRGAGKFTEDGKIVLESQLLTPAGEPDGRLQISFDVGYLQQPENANRWYQWFDLPVHAAYDPFAPDHKADPNEIRGQAEMAYTFGDGSSMTASGPAFFNLARFRDGSSIFFLSAVGVIADGSGKYLNTMGKTTSQGVVRLPQGAPFAPGITFSCQSVESLQLISRMEVEDPSPAWPYQFKTIEVTGRPQETFKMSYVEEGEGDPILFLHGNPNWSYTWRNIIPYLTPLGRCIAPDFIGMDPRQLTSETLRFTFEDHVRFFNDFIAKKNLKNITLVIHDWGSAIGFDYAMRHEDNVKGIVFMEMIYKNYPSWSTFPEPDAPELVRQNFQMFRKDYPSTDSLGYQQIVDHNVFIDLLTPTITGRAVTNAEMEELRRPFIVPKSREAIWRWVNDIPVEGMPTHTNEVVKQYHVWLQQTSLPKLFLYTVPGMIITADSVQWLQAHLSNLTSVNVGPGLHYPQETNPDLVGGTIAEWLRHVA